MNLTANVKKAEENHDDAVRELQKAQRDLHPANVAPALAAQAIARDTHTSYLTLQTWLRQSDEGLSA